MLDFAQTPQVPTDPVVTSSAQTPAQMLLGMKLQAEPPQVAPGVSPATVTPSTPEELSPPPSTLSSATQSLVQQPTTALPPEPPAEPTPDLESIAPSLPLAVQVGDTLNPMNPVGGTVKEVREPSISLEKPQLDVVPGVQYVEQEKNPELPPEVDGFLKKVESHQDQLPQEVVITHPDLSLQPTKYLAKPVIVLPITPAGEKAGQNKSTQYSLRWLVEWSHKIMKMFSGKVIYRSE